MTQIVKVRFKEGGKEYDFHSAGFAPQKGQWVMVETSRGEECGLVTQEPAAVEEDKLPKNVKPVLRIADDADLRRMRQNREEEKRAFAVAEEKIAKHGLEMKLVEVECAFDRSKILFYFTADGRVDFRDLVKDLAGVFRTRIELRQIGVRDEAKMLGGLGICGQVLCCTRFLKDFQPVSIKMAKAQGLSLNPAKISGCCGRLMCCLAYEQNSYDYLLSITPTLGSTVRTAEGMGTVTEVQLVAGKVKVRSHKEDGGVQLYPVDEVEVLRSGKDRDKASASPRREKGDKVSAKGDESVKIDQGIDS